MKFISLLLVSGFINAYAHTEFVGVLKGSATPCSLEITHTYNEGQDLLADIVLSLEDSHHHFVGVTHGEEFLFTIKSAGGNVFSGIGANGKDQANIVTKAGKLDDISAYGVKWLHGNHFHSAQCVNLKRAQH